MRIAIPLAAGRLAAHFGHCEEFVLVDVDDRRRRITASRRTQPPAHQPGLLPPWLASHGATVVIAGGMGGRARELFAAHGIEVYAGAAPLPPEDLVAAYLENRLETGANPCDHDPNEPCRGHDHGPRRTEPAS
jgi:predicted Fe-Mo cluster-binding NifX family protein